MNPVPALVAAVSVAAYILLASILLGSATVSGAGGRVRGDYKRSVVKIIPPTSSAADFLQNAAWNSTVRFGADLESTGRSSAGPKIPFRVLLIGDSVDRYTVWDWCDHVGGLLLKEDTILPFAGPPIRRHRGPGRVRPQLNAPTSQPTPTVSEFQAIIDKYRTLYARRNSLEPAFCDARAVRGIVVADITNKVGVNAHPPWMSQENVVSGLETMNFELMKDLNETFETVIGPGLDMLEDMMGGKPHAVLAHSMFWDFGRPDYSGDKENNPSRWADTWLQNVQVLLNIVKTRYVMTKPPQIPARIARDVYCISEFHMSDTWLGWRTGNHFQVVRDIGHWNNQRAYDLMLAMNKRARNELVRPHKGNVDVTDVYVPAMYTKDAIHPTAKWSIKMLDTTLERALTLLNLTDC
jgi:hypothetical protein